MNVHIDGLDELLKKLDDLDNIEADKAFQEGLVDGALIVVEEAKRLVPVRTGDLRDSLHVGGFADRTPGYRKIGAYGELKKPIGKGKSYGVLAGSTLPYAHLVEKGSTHSRPQPFLRPAADTKQQEIVEAVGDAIQEVIDR